MKKKYRVLVYPAVLKTASMAGLAGNEVLEFDQLTREEAWSLVGHCVNSDRQRMCIEVHSGGSVIFLGSASDCPKRFDRRRS